MIALMFVFVSIIILYVSILEEVNRDMRVQKLMLQFSFYLTLARKPCSVFAESFNVENSQVLNRSNTTNCKVVLKKHDPQKESNSKRRSLRLQAKSYLTNPLIDVKSDCNKNQNISPSKSKSSLIINDLEAKKDVTKSSPVPNQFFEHLASPRRLKLNFVDFDSNNTKNVNEAPDYAFTVFEYMRTRESKFIVKPNYLSSQAELTSDMRAILVDWMVEVQENFELNHETLYLAVKLVDHYLQEVSVKRDKLQLVGATSLLIAAKFDERHPPYVDDFLYICDDAYKRNDILSTERAILIQIGFDINIPISYRFLRRYAKCIKICMETLTLGRFILELSLQSYAMVDRSASLLAAAALWLALKMKKLTQKWNETLIYYTARNENEIFDLAGELNKMIVESKSKKLKTIWYKYSHSTFYEVAKTPTLSDEEIEVERIRILSSISPSTDSAD